MKSRIRVKFDLKQKIPAGLPISDENGVLIGETVDPLPEAEPLELGEADIEVSEEFLAKVSGDDESFQGISFSGKVAYEKA